MLEFYHTSLSQSSHFDSSISSSKQWVKFLPRKPAESVHPPLTMGLNIDSFVITLSNMMRLQIV